MRRRDAQFLTDLRRLQPEMLAHQERARGLLRQPVEAFLQGGEEGLLLQRFVRPVPCGRVFAPVIVGREEGIGRTRQKGRIVGEDGLLMHRFPHRSRLDVARLLLERGKERRDNYVDNHPEAADQPSDPLRKLPIDFRNFLYLNKNPRVRVLPYNSALLANNHTLFMIGDFKRRNEGDAALVEWQQRHYPAIIRSLDGKLASGWFTTTEHTQPTLTVMQHQVHEIGFLWDEVQNGQLRDYDRRAQGFFAGIYVDGELFGSIIDILRGDDDRRSFYAPDGTLYTEDTPGNMPHGTTLSLEDEPVTEDDDWVLRDDDGEDDDEGEEVKPAAEKKSTRKPAAKKKKPAASKRKRS